MHRIVMGRITWVCATCAEHFTRKYSASRHNNNLHFGNGLIVTLLDYIVGRASHHHINTYRAILEPTKTITTLFMIMIPNGHQNWFSQAIASNNRPYLANNNNMYEKPNSSYCTILDPINEAVIDKVREKTKI